MGEWDFRPGDLVVPFIFVPHGAPEPTEWMAAHPGWVKFPATFVPREPETPEPATPAVMASATAAEAIGEDAVAALARLGAAVSLVAAPLLALTTALYPSHTAPAELDEVHPGGRGFAPPGPLPPLPGRAPPVPLDRRPGEGGFTAPPPTPALPGFVQAAPLPSVLPGRPVAEQAPTILQQNRNEGLSGGARTRSDRARKAARAADPEVTQVLPDAAWEAHHLITLEGLRRIPEVIEGARQAGWRTDEPGNVAALPASPEAQRRLRAEGIERPVHDSGHRVWNDEVKDHLLAIKQYLSNHNLQPGTEAYNFRARQELEELQDLLRREMMKSGRLTQNETAASVHRA